MVLIDRDDVSLVSSGGRDVTTITGTASGGALGTIVVTPGVSGVTIGQSGQGFTINGFDGPSPGIETAAVYLPGAHDDIEIEGNITFTNNQITGTAGGVNGDGQQGNTLVTIDAANPTITGNDFAGFTNRFATQLRVRAGPWSTCNRELPSRRLPASTHCRTSRT